MESIKENDLALQRERVTTVAKTWLVEAVNPSTGEKKMIDVSNFSSVVAGQIGAATILRDGLLQKGTLGYANSAKSLKLFTTNTSNFSVGCLVAASVSTGGAPPALDYVAVSRNINSSTIVAERKNLYSRGNYSLPILYKENSDHSVSVYVQRTDFTPVYGAIITCGIQNLKEGLLTVLDDSTELEDAIPLTEV